MFIWNFLDGSVKIIIEVLVGGAVKVVGGWLIFLYLEIDKNRFYEIKNFIVKGKSYFFINEYVDFFSKLEN